VLCVEISKERNTIPVAEIASFCRIRGVYDDVVLCEGSAEVLRRLAYSKRVDELLFTCRIDELFEAMPEMEYDDFSVRVFNAGADKGGMERSIGSMIRGSVRLEDPRNELRVFIEGEEVLFCRSLFTIRERFDDRRATKRPFFSPTSLHPRLARAMINLSGAEREVFDPFCGTGGILIEGALMGLGVHGSDIQQRMIDGCRENMGFFGLEGYSLERSDVCDLDAEGLEAIVSDMPYGKSSYTGREPLEQLYSRSFAKFYEMLKPGGRAVICTNNPGLLMQPDTGLSLISLHSLYVNKSMRRWIGVFTKT